MEKVKKLFEAGISDRYEEAAALTDLIEAAESERDKLDIMVYAIQNYKLTEVTGIQVPLTERKMTSERWKALRKLEGDVFDAQIQRAFRGFPLVEDAAGRLLKLFETQPSVEYKDFFLANILADNQIPYLDIPGKHNMIDMQNEKFKLLQKKLAKDIRRVHYVIKSAKLEQRTQRASLLMSILNSVEDPEEKVVLMTHILDVPEKAALRLIEMERRGAGHE